MSKELIAQIIGIIALGVAALSFQSRRQKRLVFMQFIASALFCVHYLMLGGMVGFCMNVIGMARGLVFSKRDKAWAQHIAWPILFIAASLALTVLTGRVWYDYLPVVGMALTTVGFRMKEAGSVRRLSLGSVPFWLTYNICARSMGGTLTELLNLASILIAMFHLDRNSASKNQSGIEK